MFEAIAVLYSRLRRRGIPALQAYYQARNTVRAREWDGAQDWENVEDGGMYGWRTVVPCDGYAVCVEYWDDMDGGLVPEGIENEPDLCSYYANDATWAGYVIEAIDTDGETIAQDSCWGRETNFPGSLLDERETMSEWIAVERWIVNGEPAATVLEGIFRDAERELVERADAAARDIVTIG